MRSRVRKYRDKNDFLRPVLALNQVDLDKALRSQLWGQIIFFVNVIPAGHDASSRERLWPLALETLEKVEACLRVED